MTRLSRINLINLSSSATKNYAGFA